MSKKIVLSLFDHSTEFVKPWAGKGYICYCIDIQHPKGYTLARKNIWKVGMTVEEFIKTFSFLGSVSFIASFPPCTDLAVSGAAHFKNKFSKDPFYREKALKLVYLASTLGIYLKVPFFIENPVSVISSCWRKPDYIFHPWEFGNYLEENDPHPIYPEYIETQDRYNKKTCLWTDNLFIFPEKKPTIPPIGYSKQHKLLGGKSLKTKNIRSATPRGFSTAVCEANS